MNDPSIDTSTRELVAKKALLVGLIGMFISSSVFWLWLPLLQHFTLIQYFRQVLPVLLPFSIFVGIVITYFAYFTLKYKERYKIVKIIMWIGIIGYILLYIFYVFLMIVFSGMGHV